MKLVYKTYRIYYLNPNIPGDKLKGLREIKARSQEEADRKAGLILETTGMYFRCDLIG
jgi:hypothetical protein